VQSVAESEPQGRPSLIDNRVMVAAALADESLVLELLNRFFAAVSFPEGGTPAYPQLTELFSAEGRLIRAGTQAPQSRRVDDFIDERRRVPADGGPTSFHEAELSGHTDVFGAVAHRLSIYTKSGNGPAGPFAARGVISTQFVREPGGWRICSMAWDDERPGLSIPT
jgi:hypothetical protein